MLHQKTLQCCDFSTVVQSGINVLDTLSVEKKEEERDRGKEREKRKGQTGRPTG